MRTCKRCKTNEAAKGSLNCEKCNERNRKHTANLIAESKAKQVRWTINNTKEIYEDRLKTK